MNPKNYFGFALEMPDDSRSPGWEKEREVCGTDETELWSFDYTLMCFLNAKLKVALEWGTYAHLDASVLPELIELTQPYVDNTVAIDTKHENYLRIMQLLTENLSGMWY